MSLDDTQVIDAIGTETESGIVVLSIIDGWDWDEEIAHLEALQSKLNAYFEFVDSGQIIDAYPDATGRSLRIDIITKFPLPHRAEEFLEKATLAASRLDIGLQSRIA